jgi:surfactin synthase thioesterase subunit/acyl carrier protein
VLSFGSPSDVPLDKPLKDLGLDSLTAVELGNALSNRTGANIPATLALNHPTAAAIATYLLANVMGASARVESSSSVTAYCEQLNVVNQLEARLFCFHGAGGSTVMFGPLAELGGSGVEIHGISHARSETPSSHGSERYLQQAVSYVASLSSQPYALLGHSLGCLFAWRVLQELAARGHRLPKVFFPSSLGLDALDHLHRSPVDFSAVAVMAAGKFAETEHLKVACAADVTLARALCKPERQTLAVPVRISALLAREDPFVNEQAVRTWAGATTSEFSLTVLPGGHSYLVDEGSRPLLLDVLRRDLLFRE